MNESARPLIDLVNAIKDIGDLGGEVRRLYSIEAWARGTLPFAEGDQVAIAKDLQIAETSGWYPYHECLALGATGMAKRIWFDELSTWLVEFRPNVEWVREADGKIHPNEGDRHAFVLAVSELRPADE